MMVGNGCIGEAAGVCGNAAGSERFHISEQAGHGLISPPTYDAIIAACGPMFNVSGGACNTAIRAASTEVGNVNTYDIYGNCVSCVGWPG